MTTFAITLEKADTGATRALIIARDDDGSKMVADIYEADDAHLDVMWSLVADCYPGLTHVLVDGEFVDADCLSVREAAEAAL